MWWTFSCIFQHLFFYRSHGAKSADCALIGTWGWLDRNESETGKIHWMCHASVWRHMVRVSDSILPHLIFMSCCCICDIYKIYIYINVVVKLWPSFFLPFVYPPFFFLPSFIPSIHSSIHQPILNEIYQLTLLLRDIPRHLRSCQHFIHFSGKHQCENR